ncbi:VOC family protein [Sphingobium nicotianae]|uniref:VOC family protein n=1 Tax=Sphingobium nicotianae TaxID=2782607 RepID=A0A9X1DAS2_9SPHN|nr:VOC family protein [Sphingobium nicotianae]MBT2186610.1 VOC family protein [Sphingobium nicotianae]
MRNKHGEFIWYELMTPDVPGAKAFYEAVVGWKISDESASPGMDYRMISAPDAMIGGVLPIDKDMADHGARPVWVGYIGVDDVDAAVAGIKERGGNVHMGPVDISAGRLAMATDPQGALFYVMRGAVDAVSTAFATGKDGHCEWNELSIPDQKAAHDFYEGLFGWTNPESMPMGAMGDYRFLYAGDIRIGATVEQKDRPAYWLHYFHVPSINASIDAVKAHGGSIMMGPHEVPGGGNIVIGTDPQGATFALSGPL